MEGTGSYFRHSDPRIHQCLVAAEDDLASPMAEEVEPVSNDDAMDRMPLSLLTAPAESIVLAPPWSESDAKHVELAVYPPMTNAVQLDQPLQRGEIVLIHLGPHTVRQTMV